jgi:hypothetical protein
VRAVHALGALAQHLQAAAANTHRRWSCCSLATCLDAATTSARIHSTQHTCIWTKPCVVSAVGPRAGSTGAAAGPAFGRYPV